jgi:hypothetical protein
VSAPARLVPWHPRLTSANWMQAGQCLPPTMESSSEATK